jgi:hypothetical protein
MTQVIENIGRREWITPGILPSALRAALRAFKFAPGKFVEPPTPTMSILCAIIHKAYEYERIFWVFV